MTHEKEVWGRFSPDYELLDSLNLDTKACVSIDNISIPWNSSRRDKAPLITSNYRKVS